MAKDSFIFYREWMLLVSTLPDASRLRFFDMICAYEGGDIPVTGDNHLDGVVKFVFSKVAENNKKYAKKCEKAAESANVRWHANASERIDSHTNALPPNANLKNAMLNDNDNDNDNDNVFVNTNNTPLPPSPTGSGESKRKSRKTIVEMTKDSAIAHYKNEYEVAREAGGAEADRFRDIGREICGMKTLECPAGMINTVMRLPEQLYYDQYLNLCKVMGGHATVRSILLEMHNGYEEYLTKRKSINLVAQDWYKNRVKREGAAGGKYNQQGTGNVKASSKEGEFNR